MDGAPALILRDAQSGKATLCYVGQALVAGREAQDAGQTIVCPDPHVSRRHCTLEALPDGTLRVTDTSSYGTYINGLPVKGQAIASPGDTLVLGHRYALVVHQQVDTEAPTVASPAAPTEWTPQTRTRPAAGAAASELESGPVGGRYRIQEVLGEGGMGVVYRAHDELERRPCALKVLRATMANAGDDEALTRFRREATLTFKLRAHPGVVQVFDAGTIQPGGQLYYVMAFIDGESLSRKIAHGLTQDEGAWLVAQVARAVAYAHEQGVIHRDLKPANVLVSKAGVVHLADFGVARFLDDEQSRLTLSGATLGTPSYMAPEQIEDSKQAGPLADVYGLGAILYAVLTRQPPFLQKRLGRLIEAVQTGAMAKPRQLEPTVDPGLEAICLKAMAVQTADRYPTAAAMADALEAWLERRATGSAETLIQ